MRRIEFSYSLVLPALLAGILLVPFAMNYVSHFMAQKRATNTLIMKLPLDNSAISMPMEVKQFERFKVALQFDSRNLANRINDIVSAASKGATIQGINGRVFPEMKAELMGDDFKFDNPGPQDQLFVINDETVWTWHVFPEKAGRHALTFRLYLNTTLHEEENLKVVDLAEANISVQQASLAKWVQHNWEWLTALLILPVIIWILRYRFIPVKS